MSPSMYDLENLGDIEDHIGNSTGLHLLVHVNSHNLKRDQIEKKKKASEQHKITQETIRSVGKKIITCIII